MAADPKAPVENEEPSEGAGYVEASFPEFGACVSRHSLSCLPLRSQSSLGSAASQGRRLLCYLRLFSLCQWLFEFVPLIAVVP